jgi:Tol biopolymer transport system component
MRVPGDLELDDVSPEGHVLVNHHTTTRSVRLFSAEGPNPRELSWLDDSFVSDLSDDGRMLLLTERGEGGSGAMIYLRSTDGAPAVKLGPGNGRALSPDGRWVLAHNATSEGGEESLSLLPTGPGQPRTLERDGIVDYGWGDWLPDGSSVVFSASKADGVSRLFVQAVPDGKPRSFGPENTRLQPGTSPVSPDGRHVVGFRAGQTVVLPIDGGGEARPLAGLSRSDRAAQWTPDGGALYVLGLVEGTIRTLDLATGRESLVRQVPVDEAAQVTQIRVTPDARTWVYANSRTVSELYLVEGLR